MGDGLATAVSGDRVLVLDGAMGTELERRGVASALPLWSATALLEAPDVVRSIHSEYAAAGADLLTSNTFRTQRRTLAKIGLGARDAELTALAVSLARQGAATEARREPNPWLLGSAPTLEDCYRPDLVPGEEALASEHARHAENLVAAGVDGILVETIGSVREARTAARAAAATGLPFFVSFLPRAYPGGDEAPAEIDLLSGEALEAAIDCVLPSRPAALLVNCIPANQVDRNFDLLQRAGIPFGAYANLGAPLNRGSTTPTHYSDEETPESFAMAAARWVARGASVVGGCCGTRPDYTRAIVEQVKRSAAP